MKSIIKVLLSLFLIIGTVAYAADTASILPPAKTTFVDQNGKPLTSGTVDNYIPSTTTRKATWQDAAETILNTNPVVLDAAGRALILGSGSYRQVVKDRLGNLIWDQVTSSSGSSSGGSSATTGDGDLVGTVKPWAGLTAPNQYMLTYGQEISRTTYSALFTAITSTQVVFCNSGSPVLNGLADTTNFWVGMSVEVTCLASGTSTVISKTPTTVTLAANANITLNTNAVFFPWGRGNGVTTFNIPDYRGLIPLPNNNMGGVASSNIAFDAFFTTNPNSIGASAGNQFTTLIPQNLPAYTPSGTITNGAITNTVTGGTKGAIANTTAVSAAGHAFADVGSDIAVNSTQATSTFTGIAQGGTSAVFSRLPPVKTINYVIKVTPDTNSTTASGVTSLGGMTGDIACGAGLSCTGNIVSSLIGAGTSGYALIGNGPSVSATFQAFTQVGTGAIARTWQSKATDSVNVKDFGAVCDGVTNDGPSAQLAHNTGKLVIYPAGTCYIATPIVLTSGYFLAKGQGPRITNILTKAADMPSGTSPGIPVSWNAYSLTGMSGVYFENMTIDGNTSASTNPSTSTLSDLRVPIEIIDSNNTYFNNMEFFQIKAPIYNYSIPAASATLIPQLKTGQFWIASTTGNCRNITILNTRIKYPSFVEGGWVVNCQNVWIDNFRSFDDNANLHRSLSTPLNILGPLSDNVWINNTYIKDHLGSSMNLGTSHLKVTNSVIAGPTLYTQAMPGFLLTATTTNGSPTITLTAGGAPPNYCGGLTHVSVGQKITGAGIPASTTVVSCNLATLVMSANATSTAVGVTVTLGAGTGATDQVRYGGGIDSAQELTYSLFTDQGPVTDLEFTGNTIYGQDDHCISVGNSLAAVGTFNYSKVVATNNTCYDVPVGIRINGTNGGTIANNYTDNIRAYASNNDYYFSGPFEGYSILYNNSKNFSIQSNSFDGGTGVAYAGIDAFALKGIVTVNINNSLIAGNGIRDFITNQISATTTVNNTGSDLLFINNAFHGTPVLDMVIGETGLALNRADISGNTRNGVPVATSNTSIFITNLDGVPLAGLVGSEALRAVPLASAVNRVDITGAVTTASPIIAAGGSDTNIDLKLTPKGSGTVKITTLTTPGYISNDASGSIISAAVNTTINGGGATNSIAAAATGWVGIGLQCLATEAFCYLIQPQTGIISNFYINTNTFPGVGQTYTVTMRKNASNQTVTCIISGGSATSCNDTTHSFTVAAGDNVSVQIANSAGGNTVSTSNFGFKLAISP